MLAKHNFQNSGNSLNKIINEGGESGWTAVHWAVYFGNLDIFQELLVFGGDINSEAEDGWTPLQLAVYKNNKSSNDADFGLICLSNLSCGSSFKKSAYQGKCCYQERYCASYCFQKWTS